MGWGARIGDGGVGMGGGGWGKGGPSNHHLLLAHVMLQLHAKQVN